MHPNAHLEDIPGQPGMKGMPGEYPAEKALRCFLSPDRACGADCMSFMTSVPQGGDYQNQAWPHCLLLLNAHRVGKHLVILAEIAAKMLRPDPHREQTKIPPPEVR